jgi:hypothetical protein
MKSVTAHVVKTEKDFLHVALDLKNSIFTLPIIKIPQSFSRFGREPTQQKDMGVAVPGHYYLGGNDAFSGGTANFYPRSNLSALSFQPLSNLNAPNRDYDTHWETGGPNGWKVKVMEAQQQQQGQSGQTGGTSSGGGGGGANPALAAIPRTHRQIMERRNIIWAQRQASMAAQRQASVRATANGGSSGGTSSSSDTGGIGSQGGDQSDLTEFSFDKNGKAVIQSKDANHVITVDQQSGKISLKVPTNKTIYVGGDGSEGQYDNLVTKSGQVVINAKGRIG